MSNLLILHKNAKIFYIVTLSFLFTGLIPQVLAIHEQNQTAASQSLLNQTNNIQPPNMRNPLMGLPPASVLPSTRIQTDNVSIGATMANELTPTRTSLHDQTALDTDQLQYEKYVNDLYGFSILHPPNWEVDEREIDDFTERLKEDTLNEPWKAFDDVCFLAPDIEIEQRLQGGLATPARLCVTVLEVKSEEYLDTKDMTVKTRLVNEMTAKEIAESAHDYESQMGMLGAGMLDSELSNEVVSSNETTFGVGNYPAFRIDSTASATSQYGKATDYDIDIYSVLGEKIYMIRTSSPDLVTPEYMPILLNMINSFNIIDEQSAGQ